MPRRNSRPEKGSTYPVTKEGCKIWINVSKAGKRSIEVAYDLRFTLHFTRKPRAKVTRKTE